MADSTPVLSIVIPCLNEARTIEAQLSRLTEEVFSEPWEIIVADNGSTDATRSVVQRYCERLPAVRLVDASARRGAAHARNVGAAAASGEFVVFCDADDEVQPGWVAAMGEALREHDVVAGRLDSEKLNEEWLYDLRAFPQNNGLMTFDPGPPFALTANLGVRRSLHERIGGFDESFLGSAHDIDYCWRLQHAGAELHFEPRAVIAYRFRVNPRAIFQQARFYGIGWVSLYKKHRDSGLPEQRHPWLLGVLSWLGMLGRLPIPPSKRTLASFAWNLGWKLGMLEGSVRNRVVLLSIRGIV
jgi:glycosyltransferase involved in cell wall biosynthesis